MADRVAQTVVELLIEPELDCLFPTDSYGYRVGEVDQTGSRNHPPTLLEYELGGGVLLPMGLDHIDHGLLSKTVKYHIKGEWIMLYIERWLKTPSRLQVAFACPVKVVLRKAGWSAYC